MKKRASIRNPSMVFAFKLGKGGKDTNRKKELKKGKGGDHNKGSRVCSLRGDLAQS